MNFSFSKWSIDFTALHAFCAASRKCLFQRSASSLWTHIWKPKLFAKVWSNLFTLHIVNSSEWQASWDQIKTNNPLFPKGKRKRHFERKYKMVNKDGAWKREENELWMNWAEYQKQYLGLILLLGHYEGETIFSILEEFTKASYLGRLWSLRECDALLR